MAIPKKLLNHLEKNKVKYETITHKTVYTAYDLAQTLDMDLKEIAKTLVVKADLPVGLSADKAGEAGKNYVYVLVVLSAAQLLDLGKLKKLLKAKKIEIAKEQVMKVAFKIKPGTITPFGAIYKVPVCFEKGLTKMKKIIVGGGSYNDAIKIKPWILLN